MKSLNPGGGRHHDCPLSANAPVELVFKELKSGLHLGRMQVTKEPERVKRSLALPVIAYLLLLRL